MRGSPLLRALLAFVAILLLGYPLWRLTGEAPAPALAVAAAAPAAEVKLQLTFTSPPKSFIVRHLGREIWSSQAAASVAEEVLRIPYPKEGVELQFSADFPDAATLAAVRLVLTDPQGDDREKSCWGSGHIDEIVTFP